jgi:hypothetical protein
MSETQSCGAWMVTLNYNPREKRKGIKFQVKTFSSFEDGCLM